MLRLTVPSLAFLGLQQSSGRRIELWKQRTALCHQPRRYDLCSARCRLCVLSRWVSFGSRLQHRISCERCHSLPRSSRWSRLEPLLLVGDRRSFLQSEFTFCRMDRTQLTFSFSISVVLVAHLRKPILVTCLLLYRCTAE